MITGCSFALQQRSGVAAIWTFWIYPRAAESKGAAKVGLKQCIVETILLRTFKYILSTKFFAVTIIFVSKIQSVFHRHSVEHIHLKHITTALQRILHTIRSLHVAWLEIIIGLLHMAIIVSVIMSQSHTSQWSSVVYQYDFMLCEDAWYLRVACTKQSKLLVCN